MEMADAYLHGQVGIAHSAVDCQFGQCLAAIFLHSVEDCLGLVTGCFQSGSGNVAFLGILGDSNYMELDRILQVRAAEG